MALYKCIFIYLFIYIGIVLARQKDIEAQFWAAYCRRVWEKIKRLCQEACYGCSHRKLDERHHFTCRMSDVDCIRRFMEMAMCDVWCFEVMRDWYDALSVLKPRLSENEMLLFDVPWVLHQMERPDRIAILRELMVGDAMDYEGLVDPFPSMTDEELLEAADEMETQHNNNNTTQQPESTDTTQQPESTGMAFDFDGEFLGPMEEGEESGVTGMEEEERNVAFLPLNPNCWAHFRPAQAEHACCNYGQPEEPEEDITDVQEGVCVIFCSLLLFFLFILSIFCSPE